MLKSIDEYFKTLAICENVKRPYRPDNVKYVPTIEDLEEHQVAEHMDFYYPYLVFYGDKDCFDGGEEFEPVYQYIQKLLKEAAKKENEK